MRVINKKEVGNRIKDIRLSLGYTQQQFGDLFNASKGNVATWEKGISLPNAKRLKKIADLGNKDVKEIIYGYDKQITIKVNESKEISNNLNETINQLDEMVLIFDDIILAISNEKQNGGLDHLTFKQTKYSKDELLNAIKDVKNTPLFDEVFNDLKEQTEVLKNELQKTKDIINHHADK